MMKNIQKRRITMKISAEKLRRYRKKTGLKSQEFAELCNIPIGTYFSYESGARSPKEKRMCTIAKNLGVSVYDIIESNSNYLKNQITKGYKSSNDIAKERVEIDIKLLKIKREQYFNNAVELADRIGVCISSYYTYERGTVKPTRAIVRKLCNELNLSFARLVRE